MKDLNSLKLRIRFFSKFSPSGGTHPEFPEALLIYRRSSCRPVFPDQDEPDLLFNLIRTDLISCLTFSGK